MIFVITVILALNAEALGIASDYLPNNTLELMPGESRIYGIRLQNQEDGLKARVMLYSDSEIAHIVDYKEIYTLAAGSMPLQINISIPKSAEPGALSGKLYTVGISVEPLSSAGQGNIGLTARIGKDFMVKVAEEKPVETAAKAEIIKEKENRGKNLYVILFVIGIFFIIYFWRRLFT